MQDAYDVAVIGAGIVGLGQALAAARRGHRVIVLDRDAQANGASVRNFGFITVTGQSAGKTWERARRSRDIWAEVAPRAGIPIEHTGLVVLARRPEAATVLDAFASHAMGEDCELLDARVARQRFPNLSPQSLSAALWSPHELRVESRHAIGQLAAWLEDEMGVVFRRQTAVCAVEPPFIETTTGPVFADAAVVCPGDDFVSLFPERLAPFGLLRCQLQMLRVVPPFQGWRLPGGLMSDLSLVRYPGYAALPEARALQARLEREQPEHLAQGIHLIAVQGSDGSLIIGDSHHNAATPPPFANAQVDALIIDECEAALGHRLGPVIERWTGSYAKADDREALIDSPGRRVRLVVVTSGTGASTAFALGEEVMASL